MIYLTDPTQRFIEEAEKVGNGVGTENGACKEAMDWLRPHAARPVKEVIAETPEQWITWSILFVPNMSPAVRKAMARRISKPMMAFRLSEECPDLEGVLSHRYAGKHYAAERQKRRERKAREGR